MGIIVCGLNGSGKSTIGRKLAECLGYDFIDNEDLYFSKSDTSNPFSDPRSKDEVIRILEEMIADHNHFVFAAVKGDYGEKLVSLLDHVILLEVPKQIRMQRVRDRSFMKFGDRMLPGGDLFEKENEWFSLVDSRPEDYAEKWVENVKCPVVRLDGTKPIEQNVAFLLSILT